MAKRYGFSLIGVGGSRKEWKVPRNRYMEVPHWSC